MNDIVRKVNRNFQQFWFCIIRDSKVFYVLKISLAFSTIAFIMFVYYLRKDKKLMLRYSENIGYLRLIKPDVNKYDALLLSPRGVNKEVLYRVVKKFHSFPNGITNFGNNCYINVLLQCLASNPDFIIFLKNFLESGERLNLSKRDLEIIRELEEVLEQINHEKSVISPYNFINHINNKYEFEHEQQDSYELYHRLLEIFNCDSIAETEFNINHNPFLVEWETKYRCKKCGNVLNKREHTLDVSVSPDYTSYSITSLLDKSLKPVEISDYTCTKCSALNYLDQIDRKIKNFPGKENKKKFEILKEYVREITRENVSDTLENFKEKVLYFCEENDCTDILTNLNMLSVKSNLIKTSEIVKYPKFLTVHVQKVFFEEYAVMTNQLKIVFTENLIFRINNKETTYELTSFIEHFGSHNFGHYIAYRKFYNKWVIINDSSVNMINKDRAFEVSNPYILFYREIEKESS